MPFYKIIGNRWESSQRIIQSISDIGTIRSEATNIAKKLGLSSLQGCKIFVCETTGGDSSSSSSQQPLPKRELSFDLPIKQQDVSSMSFLFVSEDGSVPATVTSTLDGGGVLPKKDDAVSDQKPDEKPAATAAVILGTETTSATTASSSSTAEPPKLLGPAATSTSNNSNNASAEALLEGSSKNNSSSVLTTNSDNNMMNASTATAKPPMSPVSKSSTSNNNNNNNAQPSPTTTVVDNTSSANQKQKQDQDQQLAKQLEEERKKREEFEQQVKALLAQQKQQQEKQDQDRLEQLKKQDEAERKQEEAKANARKDADQSRQRQREKEDELLQQLQKQSHHSSQPKTPAISPLPKNQQQQHQDENNQNIHNISATSSSASLSARYGFAWELLKKRQQNKHANVSDAENSKNFFNDADESNGGSSRALALARSRLGALPYRSPIRARSPYHSPPSTVEQIDQIAVAAELAAAMRLQKDQEMASMGLPSTYHSSASNSPSRTSVVHVADDSQLKELISEVAHKTIEESMKDEEKKEETRKKQAQEAEEKRKKEHDEEEKRREEQRQKELQDAAALLEKQKKELENIIQQQQENIRKQEQEAEQRREKERHAHEEEEKERRKKEREEDELRQKKRHEEDERSRREHDEKMEKELATKEDLARLQNRIEQLLQVQENLSRKIEERPATLQNENNNNVNNVSVSPAVPILAASPAMMTQNQVDKERRDQQQKLSLLQQQRNAKKHQQQQQEEEEQQQQQQQEAKAKNSNNNNNNESSPQRHALNDEVNSLLNGSTNNNKNSSSSQQQQNAPNNSISNTTRTEDDFDSHFQNVMGTLPTPIRKEPNTNNNNNQKLLLGNPTTKPSSSDQQQPSFEVHHQPVATKKQPTNSSAFGRSRLPRAGSRTSSRATSRSSSVNNESASALVQDPSTMRKKPSSSNNNNNNNNPAASLQIINAAGQNSSLNNNNNSKRNNNNNSNSMSMQSYSNPLRKGSRPDHYQPPADIDDFGRYADDNNNNNNNNDYSYRENNNHNSEYYSQQQQQPITMHESMELLNEGAHKFLVNDRRAIRDWIGRVANKPMQSKLMALQQQNQSNNNIPLVNVADTIVPDVAITLVANSPQFIRSIIVPLVIDQISAAIDRRGNVVGPDGNKQKFSQLLSAVSGLGKLASDCYPLLRTWAKLGAENADKALLALALRSTGGMLAVTDAIATLKSEGASPAARNIAAYSLGLLAVDGSAAPAYRKTRIFVFDSPILEDAAVAASRAGAKGVLSLVQLEKPAPSTGGNSALDQRTAHHKLPRYARTCILISRQAALKRALEFLSSPQSLPDGYGSSNNGDDDYYDNDFVDGANWMVPPVAPKNLIDQHVETAKQLAEPLQMTDLGLPSWMDSNSSGASGGVGGALATGSSDSPVILTDAGSAFDGNYEQLVSDTQSKQVDPQLLPLRDVALHLVSLLETDDTDSSGSVQELVLLAIPKLPRESRALILEPLLRTFPGLLHMHGDTHPRVIAAAATALGDSVAVVGAAAHPTLCEDAQAVLCNLIAPSSDVVIATAACEALAMMATSINDDAPATRIFWAWEKHRLLTADSVAAALIALRAADTIAQHILYCVTAVANHGGDRGLLHRCTALVDATAEHLSYDLCSPSVAANFIEAFLGGLRMLPTETAFLVSCVRGLARIGVNPGSVPCERLDEAVTVAKTSAPPLPYWEELETVVESDLYAPPVKISIVESLVKEGGAAGEVKVTRLMLRHAFPWVRAAAARALRHSQGTPVVSLLLAANDTDPSVREASLETLEGMTQERVAEALATVQRDRVKAVAQCARDFLQFGSAEIVSLTLQICESIMEMEPRE